MVGLVTSSTTKDGAGTVVSRNETVYDDNGYSPDAARGNPTTSRVWDSTKGAWNNPSAYIQTRAKFDAYGNRYEAIDAKGNSTTTTFDSTYHAFPIQVTSPVPSDGVYGSNTAFITYAAFNTTTGLPLSSTNANGLETRIEYDAATLRPRSTKTFYQSNQIGSTSEIVYHDEANNYWVKNRTQIDADKWAESITYFAGLGRAYKSEQVDSQGNIFSNKEFDAEGRILRVSNSYRLNNDPCYQNNQIVCWTTNTYDQASRIKEVTTPDGAKVVTDYGISTAGGFIGTTKQVTDQAGKKRKGISDALGRMVRVIEDPTGQNLHTDYVFDTLGNLRKTTQGEQNRYFSYDSLGRLLYAKQPEEDNGSFTYTDLITGNTGWSVRYQYDDSGNITTTTDAKGVSVTGTYDNFDRLKTRDYSDSTPDVSFYNDGKGLAQAPTCPTDPTKTCANGRITKVSSSVSETRYKQFDELGRLLSHEQITDGNTYPTSYVYNLSGAMIEETYPSGRKVRNVLNNDGELAAVQSKKNSGYGYFNYADSFTYDSAGAVTKMQLGNGKWETAAYNNRMQVIQIGLGTTDAQTDLLNLEYKYSTGTNTDNNGSLLEQKITVPASGGSTGFAATQTYTYDSLNRLEIAEEKVSGATTWKQKFSIDRYGNRRFDAPNTTTLGSCSQAVCNPLINTSDNRFTDGQGYSYDANGNLTADAEGKQFLYDAENHQKEVKDQYNATLGSYLYDGEGKRVKKTTNTEITVFVYNGGGKLVAEYSNQISQTPQVSYLTQDHLGSARIITDQNGAVSTRKDYSAFGDETFTAQRTSGLKYDSSETRKGYTGYEKDGESGLDFAQARYYSSIHGRFTSIDPLTASANVKNPQTFNRYSYVLNSPYKFSDPLGLISSSTGACGGWCQNGESSLVSRGGADSKDVSSNFLAETEETDEGVAGEEQNQDGILVETRQYSFSATQVDPDTGVVAQVVFDVTEDHYIVYRDGEFRPWVRTQVFAENGPRAQYKISDANLTIMADVVAKIISVAETGGGIDKTIALGIAAKETFFGTSGSRKDRAYNPMQYTGGVKGFEGVSKDIYTNIKASIALWNQKKGETKSEDTMTLLEGYRGKGYEPDYKNKVMKYVNENRRGIKITEVVTHPDIFITPN